jgi:uncharacterized protein (TIGR02271 family)
MTALRAEITSRDDGWEIRLPLRREVVSVEKRTVVVEEVRVRRAGQTESQAVQATVRRERLRVDTFGDPETPELHIRRTKPGQP